MEKTMVLWNKLWYRTENSETLINYGKKNIILCTNYGPIVNYS